MWLTELFLILAMTSLMTSHVVDELEHGFLYGSPWLEGWQQYKSKYGKVFDDEVEEERRYKTWIQNSKEIELYNAYYKQR